MITPFILLAAFMLDSLIGDPRWLPHPVRLIGRAIEKTEALLRLFARTPRAEKAAGCVLVILIVGTVYLAALLACRALDAASDPFARTASAAALIYLTSTTIALRELVGAARLVITDLGHGDLEAARGDLSMIVGRDTKGLSEKEMLKAVMETLAENLSDGVIAPLFYLALGGLPLALAYKAVNTLDSMVGYRNERYMSFGWAGARLDDVANYLPARITGALVVASCAVVFRFGPEVRSSLQTMLRDGGKHLSPNSGIPEAAVAGAVGVRFGGPSYYGGVLVEKPYIGDGGQEDYLAASGSTIGIIKVAATMGVLIAAAILTLRSVQ